MGRDDAGPGGAESAGFVAEPDPSFEELRVREHQQAIVADLGRFALEVDDEQELLDIAVKLLADGLQVPLTAAMRLSEDPEWLDIKAGTGWNAVLLETNRVSSHRSTLAGYTLEADGPVVTDDLMREERFEGGPGLRSHGVVRR